MPGILSIKNIPGIWVNKFSSWKTRYSLVDRNVSTADTRIELHCFIVLLLLFYQYVTMTLYFLSRTNQSLACFYYCWEIEKKQKV